jgi:hypothetical protein
MKLIVPVQDAWVSRASSLPPSSFGGVAGGGGGEGWRARSCLRIQSGEGGFSGKQKPGVEVAGFSGE